MEYVCVRAVKMSTKMVHLGVLQFIKFLYTSKCTFNIEIASLFLFYWFRSNSFPIIQIQ